MSINNETQTTLTFQPTQHTDVASLLDIVTVHPELLGGTPCFVGTRVPVQNLFDYLEGGESLEDFLDGFPGVSREHAERVIHFAGINLLESLRA